MTGSSGKRIKSEIVWKFVKMLQVSMCPLSNLRLNVLLAAISGLLFFTGWWLLVDRNILYPEHTKSVYNVPGVFGTLAFFIINLVPPGHFGEDHWYAGGSFFGNLVVRLILFCGFMMAFGAQIAASYIVLNEYILDEMRLQKWPGYSVFLENFCIFCGAIVMRFRRPKDDYFF